MSILSLIIGESGTGKTASLRNFDPASTLLIQTIKKPLPFRHPGWGPLKKIDGVASGNTILYDQSEQIIAKMQQTFRKVIVIDDFQYVMAHEFMLRSQETGFQKFSDIGRHAWDILRAAALLPDDVRVYVLAHSQVDEAGVTKLKTVGRLLDEKISIEGMVSIVLKTVVHGNEYTFATHNNGSDTVKTPMGMFEDDQIENDLAAVDAAICSFYGIEHPEQSETPKRARKPKATTSSAPLH